MPFLRAAFALVLAVAAACSNDTVGSTPSAEAAGAERSGDGPALWRASDEDTTLYLFGTIHVLPPNLNWRTPVFDAAFTASDTVYLETPIDQNDANLTGLVVRYGMFPPGQGLLQRLDEEEEAALTELAQQLGMPLVSLDRMRPWLAGVTLSVAFIEAEGHDPNSGVERVIAPAAREAGKELRYFETGEEQIRFFADLPEDVQLSFLMEGVRQIDEAGDLLDRMDAAWLEGDVETLGALMKEDQSASAPQVYDVLIKQRNEAWADALETLAEDEAGVFMIAVGAGHIAGEDSLATMMEERGLTVERIQ